MKGLRQLVMKRWRTIAYMQAITLAPLILHFFTGQFKGWVFESRTLGFFALAATLIIGVGPLSLLHIYLLEKRNKP